VPCQPAVRIQTSFATPACCSCHANICSGSTRPETPLSEADSYLSLCRARNFFLAPEATAPAELVARIHTEPRALDSLQNILFSLTAFYTLWSAWPTKLTIVSHPFKRQRFMELHLPAIAWPVDVPARAEFIGASTWWSATDAAVPGSRSNVAAHGEQQRGLAPWRADPRGVDEPVRAKRRARDHGLPTGSASLFVDAATAAVSGLRFEVVRGQEALCEGPQPWS
jgi:hypothetical protein